MSTTSPNNHFEGVEDMGSDAAVYLFDYHRYQDEIIPALHRLLLDGTIPSWIPALLKRLPWGSASIEEYFSPPLRQYTAELVHSCHYLTETLPFLVPDTR